MKKLIVSLVTVLSFTTSSFANSNIKVSCRDTRGLPSGLSLTISSQDDVGGLVADLTNRDNIGPFFSLGQIPVVQMEYNDDIMGAPLTFIGPDFRLDIAWDTSPTDGTYPSHINVTVQGRTWDEAMICRLDN